MLQWWWWGVPMGEWVAGQTACLCSYVTGSGPTYIHMNPVGRADLTLTRSRRDRPWQQQQQQKKKSFVLRIKSFFFEKKKTTQIVQSRLRLEQPVCDHIFGGFPESDRQRNSALETQQDHPKPAFRRAPRYTRSLSVTLWSVSINNGKNAKQRGSPRPRTGQTTCICAGHLLGVWITDISKAATRAAP